MPYRIDWLPHVRAQLRESPRRIHRDALEAILDLASEPYPPTAEFLRDHYDNTLKIKIDGWRIFYRVDDQDQVVLVLAFKRRDRETYKSIP
jgi:mRNA-degrading endonuclease RelE of RelBE toxin-antitoxin system